MLLTPQKNRILGLSLSLLAISQAYGIDGALIDHELTAEELLIARKIRIHAATEPTRPDLGAFQKFTHLYPKAAFDHELFRSGGLGIQLFRLFRNEIPHNEHPIDYFDRAIHRLENLTARTPEDYRKLISYRHWQAHTYEYEARKILSCPQVTWDHRRLKTVESLLEKARMNYLQAQEEGPHSVYAAAGEHDMFPEFGMAGMPGHSPIHHVRKHLLANEQAILTHRERMEAILRIAQ